MQQQQQQPPLLLPSLRHPPPQSPGQLSPHHQQQQPQLSPNHYQQHQQQYAQPPVSPQQQRYSLHQQIFLPSPAAPLPPRSESRSDPRRKPSSPVSPISPSSPSSPLPSSSSQPPKEQLPRGHSQQQQKGEDPNIRRTTTEQRSIDENRPPPPQRGQTSSTTVNSSANLTRTITSHLAAPKSWPKIAVGLACLQAIIISALEFALLAHVDNFFKNAYADSLASPFVLVYFTLFVFAMLFQAVLTWEASRKMNAPQTLAVFFFNAASFAYAIIQTRQIRDLRECPEWWIKHVRWADQEAATMRYYDTYLTMPTCKHLVPWGVNQRTASSIPVWDAGNLKNQTVNLLDPSIPSLSVQHVDLALQHLDNSLPFQHAIIGLMCVMLIVSSWVAWKVYREYGWDIYKELGASIQKREMMRRYHLFILFLKLNIYFSIGIVAQMACAYAYSSKQRCVSLDGTSQDCSAFHTDPFRAEIVLPALIVLALAAVTYYIIGWYAVRYANRKMMYGFLVVISTTIVAVVYAIVVAQTKTSFAMTRIWLTSFAGIQLVLNLVTVVVGVACLRDFTRGLSEMGGYFFLLCFLDVMSVY
ncbi:hypothetical protein BC832DRAFT_45438 [Gaertneriomyces semiglobifer]|nr:hypothetical protein BC832DRAFT_45438 [Gaertneriomyces semiglobifer]